MSFQCILQTAVLKKSKIALKISFVFLSLASKTHVCASQMKIFTIKAMMLLHLLSRGHQNQ